MFTARLRRAAHSLHRLYAAPAMLADIISHRCEGVHMHESPFQPRARDLVRRHLPARERLRLARLASKKMLSVLSTLLCAVPLLYLLSVVLFAQP